ncbi:MAG: hypothetical protein R3C11_17330 [Planctomycetaceae bacterium]
MEKSKTAAEFFKTADNSRNIPQTNVSTIDLEVVTLHRPVGDPLMGEKLWKEVDEIGMLVDADYETHKNLSKNGIRVGVIGSSYPAAMEELLGMTTEEESRSFSEDDSSFIVKAFTVASGGEAEINCSLAKQIDAVRIPMLDGDEISDFPEGTVCRLRVVPRRTQDGWIKMEIQPEIHHGQKAMRPTANLTGLQQKFSQQILPIFSQRFEVEMNVGEMLLITSEGDDTHSLGHHFFRSHQEAGDMQRLILIRLANINKSGALIKSARIVK